MVIKVNVMRNFLGLASAIVLLAGCDQLNLSGNENGYIRVSSVPLIQQVFTHNVPLFQGKSNEKIMEQVCNYVAGNENKEEFQRFFTGNKVDVKKLADQDAGFSFLANEEINNYARGCVSFIVTSVLSSDYVLSSQGGLKDDESKQKFLQERLIQLTPTAIRVSSFIASLAEKHEQDKYQSIEDFKKDVSQTIDDNSLEFIKEVMHGKVNMSDYKNEGAESGYSFSITGREISFYLNGSEWLGNGYAMGTNYKVNIKNKLKFVNN